MNLHDMIKFRRSTRMNDIKESESLLLELVTSEPTVMQCFRIIESTCLSQGIYCRIEGAPPTSKFQRFIDDHYIPFCKAAIRAMHTYGFIPWRMRRIRSGDQVPEVLPPGTFSWFTDTTSDDSRFGRRRRRPTDDDTRCVTYRIQCTAPGLVEEEVRMFIAYPPGLDISINSGMYATVPSPLAHILVDYKNLREAQQRRAHADAW